MPELQNHTVGIDILADETLINILAFVPYTHEQYVSFQLVSRRFQNAVTSASWRIKTLKLQIPEIWELYGAPTEADNDFVRASFAHDHRITGVVRKLSFPDDSPSQRFGLKVGMHLLNLLTHTGETENLTYEQKFALVLWTRKEVLSEQSAAAMRFVIGRWYNKLLKHKYALLARYRRDDNNGSTDAAHANIHELLSYDEILVSRALELALLLGSFTMYPSEIALKNNSKKFRKFFLLHRNCLFIACNEQLTPSFRFLGLTLPHSQRATFMQNGNWCLLSGHAGNQALESDRPHRRTQDLFQLLAAEEALNGTWPELLNELFQKFESDMWKSARVGVATIVSQIKQGLTPQEFSLPISVDDIFEGLEHTLSQNIV